MANTLTTYRVAVQAVVDDASAAAQTVIERSIKDTYQEILRQTAPYLVDSITTLRTASVGQGEYVPADFQEIIGLSYKTTGNYTTLQEGSEEDYLLNHQNDDDGFPHKYYVRANSYVIYPSPSEAGTIKETLIPVSDDLLGTSLIPDRYTKVVIDGATYRFKAYEDSPAAENYKQWYREGLRDMVLDLATRAQTPRPKLFKRK